MFRSQVCPFVFSQTTHGQAHKGPNVRHMVAATIMFANVFNLSMAVMARRQHIFSAGGNDLVEFDLTVGSALFREAAL